MSGKPMATVVTPPLPWLTVTVSTAVRGSTPPISYEYVPMAIKSSVPKVSVRYLAVRFLVPSTAVKRHVPAPSEPSAAPLVW